LTRRGILERNWDKNLKALSHAIHGHLHPQIYPHPHGFLVLDISKATAEKGWGLGFLFSLHHCLPLKVALFFILFNFIYL
jgi:hypothetical protein